MTMMTRENSLLRPLLLATTLAIGFGTLWCIFAIWLGSSSEPAWRGVNRSPVESLVVMTDGTILIQSYSPDNLVQMSYRELNGSKYEKFDRKELLTTVAMSGEHDAPNFFSAQLDWGQRVEFFVDERAPEVNWCFVHDGKPEGVGYFVGYERVSNRLIGFIGLSGFRPDPLPTDEWIPVRGKLMADYGLWSSMPFWGQSSRGWEIRPAPSDLPPRLVHVPSGNKLRLVDLAERTVTTIYEAPEPIESVGIPMLANYSGNLPSKQRPIHVRTRQKLYTLDHRYKVTRVFDLPPEIAPQSAVTWYELSNGQAILEFHTQRTARVSFPETAQNRIVYRLAEDGGVLDRIELALKTGARAENEQTNMVFFALGMPEPAIMLAVYPLMLMATETTLSYAAALNVMVERFWPAIVAVLAVASVLAVVTWRRARAFGLSRRDQIAWTIFVLLLGFPAFVGLLLHRRWPVRQACPNCHARVVRDRDTCAECGTPFPEPALQGIEIFA